MVRSHARRSGISSVDDLESESVSTERIGTKSRSADVIIHGDNIVDAEGLVGNATSLSDAIDQAIGYLGTEGGKISIARGDYNFTSQVDLSARADNTGDGTVDQDDGTPIVIDGAFWGDESAFGDDVNGTSIDCSGLSTHPLFISSNRSRRHVKLKNIRLYNVPTTVDGIHFEQLGQGVLKNIEVEGGRYSFYLDNMFSNLSLDGLYANNGKQGHYLGAPNATNIGALIARNCTASLDPAVEIDGGKGAEIDMLYIESNEGPAMSIYGDVTGMSIDGIYTEANNQSGSAIDSIVLGDTSFSPLRPTNISISGIYLNSAINKFSNSQILLDEVGQIGFKGGKIKDSDIISTSNGVGQHVFERLELVNSLDTSSAVNSSTYIENRLGGTVNRKAGATIVSGD